MRTVSVGFYFEQKFAGDQRSLRSLDAREDFQCISVGNLHSGRNRIRLAAVFPKHIDCTPLINMVHRVSIVDGLKQGCTLPFSTGQGRGSHEGVCTPARC
jgi:hypothetical protein